MASLGQDQEWRRPNLVRKRSSFGGWGDERVVQLFHQVLHQELQLQRLYLNLMGPLATDTWRSLRIQITPMLNVLYSNGCHHEKPVLSKLKTCTLKQACGVSFRTWWIYRRCKVQSLADLQSTLLIQLSALSVWPNLWSHERGPACMPEMYTRLNKRKYTCFSLSGCSFGGV